MKNKTMPNNRMNSDWQFCFALLTAYYAKRFTASNFHYIPCKLYSTFFLKQKTVITLDKIRDEDG